VRNIKLIIEYDGTNYAGWQKQNNAVTIQEVVEKAIKEITKEDVKLIGSSRTDTGVHAKGFVANFYTECKIPDEKIKDAINSKLPDDIVILKSHRVDEDFHARYNSAGKTYVYTILNRRERAAIDRNYMYHYKGQLNIEMMEQASKYLLGTHDFSAFKNKGSSVRTSVRTISDIKIINKDSIIKIYVTADGFLYNMVRIIVGTLVEAGIGKIKPECIKKILNSKDRTRAGKSAPPQGLCLMKVYY
jgi:tRNA pseudouridine38-40 synthase